MIVIGDASYGDASYCGDVSCCGNNVSRDCDNSIRLGGSSGANGNSLCRNPTSIDDSARNDFCSNAKGITPCFNNKPRKSSTISYKASNFYH
jgi:hypothetical protein